MRFSASAKAVKVVRSPAHGLLGLLAALFLLVGIDALRETAHARPLDDIKESGTIRIIAYEDNKPFSWTAEDGTAKGIDADLARLIAEKLELKLDLVLRIQGEEAGDDLRGNVWKGPLTGGGVGDVMLHVPTHRDFAMRNPEAVIGNPYFNETIAVAINEQRIPKDSSFDIFKTEKIGVKTGTVSDYFLLTYDGGALINNVAHFYKAPVGIREFKAGETAAIMGVRSELEGLLFESDHPATLITPDMDGIYQEAWTVGTAVDEKSRDLNYAIGAILTKARQDGSLAKLFEKYGVTYIPPPVTRRSDG